MPAATYMVIDPRHDHSLRVPRPDLSARVRTPNACTACHPKRDANWAAAQTRSWYGHDPQGYQRFAVAFSKADSGAVGAAKEMRAVAGDTTQPAIVRATALSRLDANANSATLDVVGAGLRDANPLVRMGALAALSGAPPELRTRYAVPLLSDPLRSIRIEAVSALADAQLVSATADQRAAFNRAAAEYVDSLRYGADQPEARVDLATFEAVRGDPTSAERDFKSAITLDPLFVPAYANLADLYRAQGRDPEGVQVLRNGLARSPKSAALHHSLGLALVRMKQNDAALKELAQAAKLDPANARFAYVYGVALHGAGQSDAAIATLLEASATHPTDADILQALASFYRERGKEAEAQRYARQLQSVLSQR
jgi:tetratricopeptide (TPR) repeat protein